MIRAGIVFRWLETEDTFRVPEAADFLLGQPEDGIIHGLQSPRNCSRTDLSQELAQAYRQETATAFRGQGDCLLPGIEPDGGSNVRHSQLLKLKPHKVAAITGAKIMPETYTITVNGKHIKSRLNPKHRFCIFCATTWD